MTESEAKSNNNPEIFMMNVVEVTIFNQLNSSEDAEVLQVSNSIRVVYRNFRIVSNHNIFT